MSDTSAEAAGIVQRAVLRRSPVDRIRDALVHSETMRELALARLRARHPERTTVELVEMLLGEPLPRGRLPVEKS
jgi:hypothetical protein